MGSGSGMSSFLYRPRYVSWYVDSAESSIPTTAALAATATSEDYCQQNQQLASPSMIPLLQLPPPGTDAGEANTTFSHQHQHQPTFTNRKNHKGFTCSPHSQLNSLFSSTLHNIDKTTNGHSGECETDDSEEGNKEKVRPSEADSQGKDEPSLLHPNDEKVHLPRSSPVISRRHRALSWHAGRTNTSNLSSCDSSSPACASLSLDQHEYLKEDLGSRPSYCQHLFPVQVDESPRCMSDPSNLKCLLSSHCFPHNEQHAQTVEHRGPGLSTFDTLHTPGLSPSTQHTKERRCSDIPDIFTDIFKTSCELEKENAHFIVVDMVLEVLEGVKWTLSCDQWTSTMDTQQHTHSKMCTQRHTSSAQDPTPRKQTHKESKRHTQDCNTGPPERENNMPRHSDNGVDTMVTPRDSLSNAEWLAQQLVSEFRRKWLPSCKPHRGRQSLRSSFQELPGTEDVAVSSSLTEEIRLRTRMRGSLNWAPPRFQIILTIQPTHRRSEVVASQHFLCAGCGTEVEHRYIKKLRYCEYLGRYFCDCCHSGSEAVIPARVLSCWDFGRYPVSDFSKQLLNSLWQQPLFDLTHVGKTLYSKVKELDKFRELQEQLLGIKKLLTACRLSGSVLAEFEHLPAHLMERPHIFSMDDFLRVKKGQLVAQAKAVLHTAIDHIEKCELCLARGFICEFCREKDVIFPFQRDICKRCTVCKTCYHKHCFVGKKCPKCTRILSRKKCPDGSKKIDL